MSESRHVVCPACDAVNRVPHDRPADKATCGRCGGKLFSGVPVELDEARFQRHVERSDIPVVVDFWASWCGPCRAMAPVFADAARRMEPRVRFAKVDVDAAPGLAGRLGIRGVPAFLVFHGGRVVAQRSGGLPPEAFRAWIAQAVQSDRFAG